ncbi:septation inhibitor protein [Salinisphaera orenii MK-B5]|uniref:Probable septum site-determining protein MinC n=1 Tax=Salinisphaera orenii MK-B5 TaxID=856730 RepID=A0A423PQB6_9GAMM|nr:septum site-determining protein MinC [Salinisphaera orenii]ROO27752.1 septation inhibitor protein [Salinisphaera orenii MK-B5]
MADTSTAAGAGVVFKGRMMTLTVLEIRDTDIERIAEQIARQLERTPDFFARMPVLLSLPGELPELARVRDAARDAGLLVVGVLDPSDAAAKAATRAGLGVLNSPARAAAERDTTATDAPEPARTGEPEAAPAPSSEREAGSRTPTRLVTRPVRSGQQIYARGGDLVVATSVSEGAEVLADGHIHIYGALRGRALAGATGDTDARIFCRRFEPDLVAIAGCYKVADAIDEGVRSRAVQVSLDDDNLTIELQE